jgi:uncharacterized protein with HEPN domain
MRGSIGDKERLGHILDAINSIQSFTTGTTSEQFLDNYMLQLAVIKLLENIGEASNKMSKETRSELSEIDWTIVIRSRNILVHDYFRINLNVIWETIKSDLPVLKQKIERILDIEG